MTVRYKLYPAALVEFLQDRWLAVAIYSAALLVVCYCGYSIINDIVGHTAGAPGGAAAPGERLLERRRLIRGIAVHGRARLDPDEDRY